jgi:hypothetical protein
MKSSVLMLNLDVNIHVSYIQNIFYNAKFFEHYRDCMNFSAVAICRRAIPSRASTLTLRKRRLAPQLRAALLGS